MKPERLLDRRVACLLIFGVLFAASVLDCGAGRGLRNGRPRENEVWIVNGAFIPVDRSVVDGTRVTWINRDSVPHTVTSGVTHYDDAFDSGAIPPGGAFTHTFYDNGVFSYFCSIYPETMRAAVIVGVSDNTLPFGP